MVPEVYDIKDYDLYIEAEVILPRDIDHQQAARVLGVSSKIEGETIVEFKHNPILNIKVYNAMLPDVAVHNYEANTIGENIYSQVNEDSH